MKTFVASLVALFAGVVVASLIVIYFVDYQPRDQADTPPAATPMTQPVPVEALPVSDDRNGFDFDFPHCEDYYVGQTCPLPAGFGE